MKTGDRRGGAGNGGRRLATRPSLFAIRCRGVTLLELLVAAGLAAGVVLVAGTLYVAVLETERTTQALLGSAPEAALGELLEDLTSCGAAGGPAPETTGDVIWWRQAVCVRVYVLDVRPGAGAPYVLRLRTAADVAAVRSLWALAAAASPPPPPPPKPPPPGPGPKGQPPPPSADRAVLVYTAGGCTCRVDFGQAVGDAAELPVACAGCTPVPGPASAWPSGSVLWELVVVRPGGRLPAGAPSWASPQGVSLLFATPKQGWPPPPPLGAGGGGGVGVFGEPFPPTLQWLPVYVHLPSPTMAAGVTLTAWGSRYFDRDPDLPAGAGLLTRDLDGNGDGELGPDEAPARRLVPASAVEGWTLWTTGFGRLRKSVPVRCGPLTISVGDTRECRSTDFRPF